jgi:TRAP-type C4-dicarboxylate transport system substrate-binding protein
MLRILAGLLVCLPLLAQAQTTLKISTQYPDGTSIVSGLKKAGEDIAAQTEGRVKLKVYPGGVMGDDRAVQRKISIGQLHGAVAQAGAFAQFYKDSQILNVPLAFKSYAEVDHVRAALDEKIKKGFEENGWVTFGGIDGGFAYVMSEEPVASVAQLREQKLWLSANDPASEKAARVFGLSPILLNIGTVLTSLQTGAVNAFAAPPVAALTLQWHSRVKHLTDVPLLYTYGVLAISKKHFAKLSAEDQKVVRSVLETTIAKLDKGSRAENIAGFDAIQEQGLVLVSPSEAEMADWQSFADKATRELVEEGEISAAMLQRLKELLAEYRAAN